MIRIANVCILLSCLAVPANALEPDRREVVVVNSRLWDGFAYREAFTPSNQNQVSLMAGNDNALSFVRTQEYYWPLSRQVYVDFENQRDELQGVLRIEKGGKPVAEVPIQLYSIVYPQGVLNGNGRLIWGDEAIGVYAQYQDDEKVFARSLVQAQRANTAYERKLLESGAARQDGQAAEVIPPPPPLPASSLRLVTRPVPGYRVVLEPGVYQATLVADGVSVAGTKRTLSAIDLKGRETLVADIVPEERWTRPLASNSAAAKVYARPGTIFYLTLTEATRFDETEYLPVVAPQADAVAGRNMWVRRKPSDRREMQGSWGGADSVRLDRQDLRVEQTDGSGFGYRVRPAKTGERSDLTAFMVAVPKDADVHRGQLQIGSVFQREIIIVFPRNTVLAALLAVLPFFGFTTWAMMRRARVRTHNQYMTIAARARAEGKRIWHLSYRVATRR